MAKEVEKVMADDQGNTYYRTHECWECKHSWSAPVVLATYATGISGEKRNYCPKCLKVADFSSAPFRTINGEKIVNKP